MLGTEVYQSPVNNRMLNFRKRGVEQANKAPKQSSPLRPSVEQMVTPVAIHFLSFPSLPATAMLRSGEEILHLGW